VTGDHPITVQAISKQVGIITTEPVIYDESTPLQQLVLAITSSLFEGMFFGPCADKNLSQVRVEDVKPAGFKRLIHNRLINTTRSTASGDWAMPRR